MVPEDGLESSRVNPTGFCVPGLVSSVVCFDGLGIGRKQQSGSPINEKPVARG